MEIVLLLCYEENLVRLIVVKIHNLGIVTYFQVFIVIKDIRDIIIVFNVVKTIKLFEKEGLKVFTTAIMIITV